MRVFRLLRNGLASALCLCLAVSAQRPSAAQTAPALQTILNAYFQSVTGISSSIVVTGFAEITVPCPQGRDCTWTPDVVLASYSQGDGSGQALFENNANDPNISVLSAGGGVLAISDIESYGVDATTAQALVSEL